MVFMTVGDDYSPYLFPPLQEVANIRDYQVNAQHLLLGKHKPGINNDDVVLILHHHHVLANLREPPERNYF